MAKEIWPWPPLRNAPVQGREELTVFSALYLVVLWLHLLKDTDALVKPHTAECIAYSDVRDNDNCEAILHRL